MKVQVIGPGCGNCQRLYAQAEAAIDATGVTATLEKVDDPLEMASYGIWMTPGLAIDGKVVSSGRVPATDEIVGWLTAVASIG